MKILDAVKRRTASTEELEKEARQKIEQAAAERQRLAGLAEEHANLSANVERYRAHLEAAKREAGKVETRRKELMESCASRYFRAQVYDHERRSFQDAFEELLRIDLKTEVIEAALPHKRAEIEAAEARIGHIEKELS